MSIEEVAAGFADSMRTDMRAILHVHLGFDPRNDLLLGELVEAGMFHVKHLLVAHACDEQREKIDHE